MSKKSNNSIGVECAFCKDKICAESKINVIWCNCRRVGITGNNAYPQIMGTGEFKFIKIKK